MRASDSPQPAPAFPTPDLELERAIALGSLRLLYQPQIDTRTGRIAGAEALVRWSGEPDAAALFARAARAGLGERLSRAVQQRAINAAAAWAGPLAGLGISINLIPQDLERADYDQWLLDEIGLAGLDPARLTVEITESALLSDCDSIAQRLERLRSYGVRVAIDDFGTGYASLSYLSRLPLDVIKIDRGLVANIVRGRRDGIVLRALVGLARDLDLDLLAEGVESAAQLALLAEWGCLRYQGFYGAGALDEAELARFAGSAQSRAA